MVDLLELNIDEITLRVTNRESERREFKASFDSNMLWKYAKTMASFANREGGVIFFGIKDSPKDLIGFVGNVPDSVVISNFLRENFEPEINFEIDTKIFFGKTVLYILIKPSSVKPIICKKQRYLKENGKNDKLLLREGAIYYRYSSSCDEIKYSELHKILHERTQNVFKSLVESVNIINTIGQQKVAIVNIDEIGGDNQTANVYVTNETAKNINWIQKGRFVESQDAGEKAFYVTRQIEIKHGLEIRKPEDPAKTHPLTKAALCSETNIKSHHIDTVLIHLTLVNVQEYHLTGNHGKKIWHQFSESAKLNILTAFPLDLVDRDMKIMALYKAAKSNISSAVNVKNSQKVK